MDDRTLWPRLIAAAAATVAAATLMSGCQSFRAAKGPVVQAPPVCADFTVSIYFVSDSAVITHEADALITSAAARARRCTASAVEVIGLADAPGDPQANLELSKKRADAVTGELAARGFKGAPIRVAAAGDAGAQTVAGQDKPLRRRVDVIFHLAPRSR